MTQQQIGGKFYVASKRTHEMLPTDNVSVSMVVTSSFQVA